MTTAFQRGAVVALAVLTTSLVGVEGAWAQVDDSRGGRVRSGRQKGATQRKVPPIVRFVSRSLEEAQAQMGEIDKMVGAGQPPAQPLIERCKKLIRWQRKARGRAAAAVDWQEYGAPEALELVKEAVLKHKAFFEALKSQVPPEAVEIVEKGIRESEVGFQRASRYSETLADHHRILKDTGRLTDSPVLEPIPQEEKSPR